MDYYLLADMTVQIGYELAVAGAETYRVEETMRRVIEAYGTEGQAFAIPNCVAVSFVTPNTKPLTIMKRVGYHGNDLERIEKLNALSRRICHCVNNSVKLRHTVADLKHYAGIDRNAGSRLKALAIITGTENKILELAHDELFFDILDSETDQNRARLTRGNVGKARNGYRLWRRCIDSNINQTLSLIHISEPTRRS